MDINDLHNALADLAGTTVDDPGLLAAVHRAARSSHRRRAALVGGSALVVVGGAVAVGAGGFPSAGHPLVPASAPQTTTTVTPAYAAPPPGMCAGGAVSASSSAQGGGGGAAGPGPTIVSWTGDPPAVGQSFKVTGTVTAATADTITVTLNAGDASGTVTLTNPGGPPTSSQSGATVELGGTRAAQTAYKVTSMSINSGATGEGFNAGPASSSAVHKAGGGPAGSGPTIVSWTGDPPAVGQSFEVTGTVTAATADTITVTLKAGDAGGTVNLTTPGTAPSGATVELGGTRTGQNAYEVTSLGMSSGGRGGCFLKSSFHSSAALSRSAS